jgi:hypothetical protein
MRAIFETVAKRWCEAEGWQVGDWNPRRRLQSASGESFALTMALGDTPSDALNLTYMLLMTGVTDFEEHKFAGALVWFQRWEIWSETIDRVGYRLISALRGDENTTLASAPAQLFSPDELLDAQAFLALPILFQWDVHLIPKDGRFLAFLSHEGRVLLISRDQHMHQSLKRRFARWNPQEGSE